MAFPKFLDPPLARFDLTILLVPTIRIFNLLRSQRKNLSLTRVHQRPLDNLMLIPSFYRHFLLRLFHEGLGSRQNSDELDRFSGKVPY